MPRPDPSLSGHVPSRARHIVDLPIEITSSIFCMLSFSDLVSVSGTCKELRALALAECKLWRTPPRATVAQLRNLGSNFLNRSKGLGLDLSVRAITQPDLSELATILKDHMHRLSYLSLEFLTDVFRDYTRDLDALWNAFQGPAPLLKSLELIGPGDRVHEPLSSIPVDIFLGVPPPNLAEVDITAFELPAVCSAFARVTRVRTSVAALTPNRSTTRVHAHFPAVQYLEILGAEHGAMFEDPHVLARVPRIDAPLELLSIDWTLERMGPRRDAATEAWLHAAAPFARYLEICYPECQGATDAVIASLADAGRVGLDINHAQWDEDYVEICAYSRKMTRTVTVAVEDLTHHLVRLLELPGTAVTDVCLPATARNMQTLAIFWRCPPPACLGLILDGDFIDTQALSFRVMDHVTRVWLHGPAGTTVYLKKVLDFLHKATPNVSSLRVCARFNLLNAQAVPSTIKLDIFPY